MALKALNINGSIAAVPIIQGGMGIGVSLSGLAGAVAGEGGIGVISAAQPGYNWEGFQNNPLKTNLEALSFHIKKAKEKAKDGLVGVNIMCALTNYGEYVKCCIENKADLIISGAGLPTKLPELVRGTGVKIAPIVSSVKAASVLLKLWDRKSGYTADMVIVEGPMAGGHLGFTEAELEKGIDFDAEVRNIIKEVSRYEEKYDRAIPTVFAGGVHDRGDIDHYLSLGCAGVQMATRFVATEECDADENFKQAYIQAGKDDVVIVKSPVGMPGRALNNAFIKGLSLASQKVDRCYTCITGCDPGKIPYCITQALANSAKGLTYQGLVFCGAKVDRVREMSTVKRVMGELTCEMAHEKSLATMP